MKTVGIPRAMSYYYLYPFFKTLFDAMEIEVTLSKPTTKTTLEKINACPTDEPCLAVKLYFAHVQELIKSNCDYIFLPKLISVENGNYCCPKFIGIPEMVKNSFELKERGLLPRIDLNNPRNMMNDFTQIASKLGVKTKRVPRIIKEAWKFQEEFGQIPVLEESTIVEAYRDLNTNNNPKFNGNVYNGSEKSTVGLIGHPYVLYEWISHNLIERFRFYERVLTPEMIDIHLIKNQLKNIYEGDRLWNFEAQMLGAALHLMENQIVNKLVLVGLFECGPVSIIEPYIEEAAEKHNIPLLKLYLDDQTGETGLQTRIEAFMDTSAETSLADKKTSIYIVTEKIKEPIIGFPSMGHLDVVVQTVLQECGIKTVKTTELNRHAIEIGKELAPEYVCLPLAVTLGQILQMLDAGANHILMVGGKGRCRFGWYAQVQELLLKRGGRSFEMVVLDSPLPLRKKGLSFIHNIAKITGNTRWDKIAKSFLFGYHKLKILDEMEIMCCNLRAYEKSRGTADRLFTNFKRRIYNAGSYQSLNSIEREYFECTQSTDLENIIPLKVLIVGEIWVVLEPFINMEIEKFLGSRDDIRVLVERDMNMSRWFRENVLHTGEMKRKAKKIREAASPFLNEHVGGHALESVGLSVIAAKNGCDGVIHLFPFTCMPEIVAQGILTKVSENANIPILSLIISEQTGEAGMETRVEAFLDLLLERRFDKKEEENLATLYRY